MRQLLLLVSLLLAIAPRVDAATRQATDLTNGLDRYGPPGPQVQALTRAIEVERAVPSPDAYFLLWVTQRLAELYGTDRPDGLGDRQRAVDLTRQALGLVDAAAVARRQSTALVIGATPQLIKYQLLKALARWQLRRYEEQGDAFDARQGPITLDAPSPPRKLWSNQPQARALLADAVTSAQQAMALESLRADEIWQPSGAERAELRTLMTDILRRQDRWEPVFEAALDLHASIYADTYLQADVSSFDRNDAARMLDGLPDGYVGHLALARQHGAPPPPESERRLFFKVLQAAATDEDSLTFDRVAARVAAKDPKLAEELRRVQQQIDDYRRAEATAVEDARKRVGAALAGDDKALSAPPSEATSRSVRLGEQLKTTWAALAAAQPALAELMRTTPLEVSEAQKLLRPGEALVLLRVNTLGSITWVVTPTASSYVTQDSLWRAPMLERLRRLRTAFDLARARRPEDVPLFDAAIAHELYRALFGPAESLLKDVRQLYVVPDPILRTLPLSLLVTAPPAPDAAYAALPWLARRYAITVLPTAASLRSITVLRDAPRSPKPLIGYGDPVLSRAPRESRAPLIGLGSRLASPDAVRALADLPDTANELRSVARTLKATEADVHLREGATESAVKAASLTDYQVVYFATHAVLPSSDDRLTEPAIVLTPPGTASEDDDGLLMAGEIVGLRLNADWVVLSACNTATGEGGRGLSGLARAFMFAGARSLLVSSWDVESAATERLMTTLFRLYTTDPDIGRAEALRRAMLQMIDQAPSPVLAHPVFWAAFVVVGDGGR